MTRRGPERQVDERFWAGRLDNARTFRRAAEALSALADEGENANPIVALIVLAAVGYGDALGNRAPDAELTRLRRILAETDNERNQIRSRVHWRFTIAAAREKLARLYPNLASPPWRSTMSR